MPTVRTKSTPETRAVSRAIKYLGSPGELARRLGVLPQHVNNWKKRGAPAARCLDIETATDGAVTRYELQPSVFGEQPADIAA